MSNTDPIKNKPGVNGGAHEGYDVPASFLWHTQCYSYIQSSPVSSQNRECNTMLILSLTRSTQTAIAKTVLIWLTFVIGS
jgi:hypothetical protein